MNKALKNIIGFQIPEFPIKLIKLGDLVYFDGALMSVFIDTEMNPFIYDWVESDDNVNRWLVYETEKTTLADYIFGKIPHFNLINNPTKDLVYSIDIDNKGVVKVCKIVSPKNIPYDYLPNNNIYFDKEDSKNLDNIISLLELEKHKNTNPQKDKKFDILEEAKKNESELINLHVKSVKNSNVGFGKIRSSILGQVLVSYNKLSELTAVSLFDEKRNASEETKIRRKKGEMKQILELGDSEFIYAKAASFSIFLKPIKQNYNLFDNSTSSEKISKTIFNLFEASTDIKELEKIKNSLNDGILNAYHDLLKEIKEKDISLSVQYANPVNNFKLENTFDSRKATSILKNLDVLEIGNSVDVKTKGTFKALDSISHTFKFESIEGDVYQGKFSDQLQEGIYFFNLKDFYNVVFEVSEVKKSGKKDIKEKILMVSCLNEP